MGSVILLSTCVSLAKTLAIRSMKSKNENKSNGSRINRVFASMSVENDFDLRCDSLDVSCVDVTFQEKLGLNQKSKNLEF